MVLGGSAIYLAFTYATGGGILGGGFGAMVNSDLDENNSWRNGYRLSAKGKKMLKGSLKGAMAGAAMGAMFGGVAGMSIDDMHANIREINERERAACIAGAPEGAIIIYTPQKPLVSADCAYE